MSAAANLLGILATVIGGSMAIPQLYRCMKFGIKGVSSTTFQIFVAADATWLAYSWTHHLWIAAFDHIFLVITGALILRCIYRENRDFVAVTKWLILVLVTSAIIAYANIAYLVIWGGILSYLLRIPQARLLRSASDVSDVSAATWLLGGISNILWFGYGALNHDMRFAVTCGLIAIFSLSLSLGAWRRQHKMKIQPRVVKAEEIQFEFAD